MKNPVTGVVFVLGAAFLLTLVQLEPVKPAVHDCQGIEYPLLREELAYGLTLFQTGEGDEKLRRQLRANLLLLENRIRPEGCRR